MQASFQAEYESKPPPVERKKRKTLDPAASPSTEASHDPAPTDHEVKAEEPRNKEMDKYLPRKLHESKKGDRLG